MKRNETKWNETKRNETKLNETKWNEMKWNDMTLNEMKWNEMKRNETKWDETHMRTQWPKHMQKNAENGSSNTRVRRAKGFAKWCPHRFQTCYKMKKTISIMFQILENNKERENKNNDYLKDCKHTSPKYASIKK